MKPQPAGVSPILFARGADQGTIRLSALVALPQGSEPPQLTAVAGRTSPPKRLYVRAGCALWRYDFSLPARARAAYRVGGSEYEVAADCSADLRIAYVSCNGQEHGDASRPAAQRNVMWRRLAAEHDRAPFALLLHGGDQLYADEVVNSHPTLAAWAAGRALDEVLTGEMREAAEQFYFERYLALCAQPELAFLSARVPSLMMWDDHDIMDGWGSMPVERLDSPIGRGLFAIARRMFMLFQLGAIEETGSGPQDGCASPGLLQTVRLPGFSIIAPDLRTERRPTRVLGVDGWRALEHALAASRVGERILIMSSVPVLGPRLSWIEKLLALFPGAQKYEDDLRDQWQSRWHRGEWQRLLRLLAQHAETNANGLTILSGEIHFATRAEMPLAHATLHQLVASGIVHPPPPRLYAASLGLLATFGEQPLPYQRVRLKSLPGHRQIYAAERNYLVLERRGETWFAVWELEASGRTAALPLS